MVTLNEKFTMLATEVVATIELLSEMFSDDVPGEGDIATLPTGVIGPYAEHVEHIRKIAEDLGLVGLQEACILFQEGLATIIGREGPLQPRERDLIHEWPTLIMGFLESPNNPKSVEALVRCLQNSGWPRALSDDDAEMLQSLFTIQITEEHLEKVDESQEPIIAVTSAVDSTVSAESPAPQMEEPLAMGVIDTPSGSEVIMPTMEPTDPHSMEALQQETARLVDILMETLLSDEESNARKVIQGIGCYIQQVERIATIAGMLGLVALQEICALFQEGLVKLGNRGQLLTPSEQSIMEIWPMLVMSYLDSPSDPKSAEPLIEPFQNPEWIIPLSEEEAGALQDLFALQAQQRLNEQSPETDTANADLATAAIETSSSCNSQDLLRQTENQGGYPRVSADGVSGDTANAIIVDNAADQEGRQERETHDRASSDTSAAQVKAEEDLASFEHGIISQQEIQNATFANNLESQEEIETGGVDLNPMDTLQIEIAELSGIVMELFPEGAEVDLNSITQGFPKYIEKVKRIGVVASTAGSMGLHDTCMMFGEILGQPGSEVVASLDSMRGLLEEWPMLVMGYLESPSDTQVIAALVGHLQNPVWSSPISEDDAEMLRTLFTLQSAEESPEELLGTMEVETETVPVSSELESAGPGLETQIHQKAENTVGPQVLSEATQELVMILRMEVSQLAESLQEYLEGAAPEVGAGSLEELAEDLERLGDAAESVGFAGLNLFSQYIRENLRMFGERGHALSDSEREVLAGWPVRVLSYLDSIYDREVCQTLAAYLQDSRWPLRIPQNDVVKVVDALAKPNLDVAEEEVEQRPKHARLEDVSLDLPEDVNSELLDSLLQELPNQTADFSAAIQRLTEGTGTLEDVDAAKRVAHTLKGAANTVGVRGIANLTHHVEDILIAFTKRATLPTGVLNDTLTNAADCLESMSEALLGISGLPSEAESLGTFQAVLDWANRIDQLGLPQGDEQPKPRENLPGLANQALPAQADTEEQAPAPMPTPAAAPRQESSSTALRVSANLVDDLLRLIGETMILTGQLQDRLQKTVAEYRSIHRQNLALQQLTFELEQLVDIQGITSPLVQDAPAGEFDPLEMDQYNELHTVTRRLVEAVADTLEMNQDVEGNLVDLNSLLINQERLQRETEEAVMRTRMVPVKTIVPRLHRSVRQACRLTDKEVKLHIVGEETLMDSNVLNELIDPLMHILRNSVDHGIERSEERAVMGKDPQGSIHLEFAREGNNILVRCQDDGAGLNLADIRYTAQERGLISSDQKLSDDELNRLILLPGFSTRTETTQVSGRGIGMDAVYSRVLAMKGSLNLRSEQQKGCLVELKLPITLMSTHGLLVRAGKHVFAVSDRGVEQILYSGSGRLDYIGGQPIFQVGDEIYELVTFEELLNLSTDQCTEDYATRPALLVKDESGTNRVVLIEEALDSRDLVVKSLGRYVPKLRGILGATVLGDGSITPVLDMPELLRSPGKHHLAPKANNRKEPAAVKSMLCALVVDDSLSARRALAQFVEDTGYEVHVARDGLEAIDVIKTKRPDILLADLEMPRMNGLELATHLRAENATQDLPIIMITSRSTEKHRQQAKAAGVNAYLTKPFSEDELLQYIQQLTSIRGAA